MTAARTLTRRALLLGNKERQLESAPSLFRPPWAVDAVAYAERCTRCDACIQACPEHVLRRDGNGQAAFDPMLGECSFCGDCVAACNSGALVQHEVPWQLRAGIESSRCLNAQHVFCATCADACPERAIRIPPGNRAQIQVDVDQCTGCGACASVCPVHAIALHDASMEPA